MRVRYLEYVVGLALIVGLAVAFYEVNVNFQSPQQVQDYIAGFGALGPLVVILLIILEVVFAPIPGTFIAIGAGAAFGALKGALYTYTGNVIGTIIAFWLSRHFGRPLVKRLFKEDKLKYYDRFFREHGVYGLWVVYIFPVFPIDMISFMTGLSSIRFRQFLKIILIGFIPNMLFLSYFGDTLLTQGLGLTTVVLGSLFILGALVAFLIAKRGKA